MKSGIVLLLCFGIPAVLVGPFLIACIYWAAAAGLGWFVPWTWVWAASMIILIPLLFLMEWRTHGEYYADAIVSSFNEEASPYLVMNDLEMLVSFAQNPRASAAGFVEVSLWGPRQVLEAWGKYSHIRMFRRVNRRRAARIIRALQSSQRGEVDALVQAEQNTPEALAALAYLIWYDWLGVSKDGKRVWLASDAAARLSKMM